MKRVVIFCAITLVFAAVGELSIVRAENRALLIGVGKDLNPNTNDLGGIKYDLEMMKNKVAPALGFSMKQIKVLQDQEATVQKIESAFKSWLINGVESGDRVLLYFSGHGSWIKDLNGDEIDDQDEVLCAYDKNWVDDRIGTLLAKIPSNETIIFIDSCHSGTSSRMVTQTNDDVHTKCLCYQGNSSGKEAKGGSMLEEILLRQYDRYVYLGACPDDKSSCDSHKGGVFTRGIVDAVKYASKNKTPLTMKLIQKKSKLYIKNCLENYPTCTRCRLPPYTPNLTGSPKLMAMDLTPKPARSELWRKLESWADKAPYKVPITLNMNRQKVGDALVITCDVPMNGYLNIIEVGSQDTEAIVLYPNKYHQDNYVHAGTRVTIPDSGEFELRASVPDTNLIVAMITEKKLNAYREGIGDAKALFRQMSLQTMRASHQVVEARAKGSFGAGKVINYVK